MSISALGTGSGLPLADLTDQLIEAEGLATSLRLDRKKSEAETQISAFGLLKVGLSNFKTALSGLGSLSSFQTRTGISSDPEKFTAKVDQNATPGAFAVTVVNPGVQHRVSSDRLKDASDTLIDDVNTSLGGGTLVITQGDSSFSVNIDPASSSLANIRDAINQSGANSGVAASLINTGDSISFVLTAANAGTDNTIKITVDDDDTADFDDAGLSQLFYDPSSGNYDALIHLEQDQAAEDAEITLDGQTITNKESRVFKDVVEGVTITALEATEQEERLTIGLNSEAIRTRVTNFVTSYNQLAGTFKQLNSFNPDSQTSSVLFADPLVRAAEGQLRRLVTAQLGGTTSAFRTLNEIGIRFNDQGELTLDSTALSEALTSDLEAVGVLFASDGSDEQLQQKLATATFAESTTVVGEGTLTISVGDDSFSLSISAANSNDTVATLRNAINDAADNTGVKATLLTVDDGNGGTDVRLQLTSDQPGAANRISISVDDTDGSDQNNAGLSQLSSINLTVIQDVSRPRPEGIVSQIKSFLDGFLAGDGAIQAREDGLNEELEEVAEQREILDRRLLALRDRIVAKFSALDAIVSQLNQTGSFLQQQFANISQISRVKGSNG